MVAADGMFLDHVFFFSLYTFSLYIAISKGDTTKEAQATMLVSDLM